jgi:predicted glycoside hydrolase/deacetylase ChbG (UPF0249 family)
VERYLIINADDYGSFLGANLATQELFEKGCITSSTVMAPCPWAKHACQWAARHPEYAIGVHLTTTSEWDGYRWGPVLAAGTNSLRDEEGYFWQTSERFEEHADLDEAVAEVRAQLARAKQFGLVPSHWDNHMGSLYGIATGRMEFLQTIFELSAEVGLPFRFPLAGLPAGEAAPSFSIPPQLLGQIFTQMQSFIKNLGVVCPDYLIPSDYPGTQEEGYGAFRDFMYTFIEGLPAGVTETFLHPSIDTGEAKAASPKGFFRVWEYTIFSDPAFQKHIAQCGIQKISYRDLKKMRG